MKMHYRLIGFCLSTIVSLLPCKIPSITKHCEDSNHSTFNPQYEYCYCTKHIRLKDYCKHLRITRHNFPYWTVISADYHYKIISAHMLIIIRNYVILFQFKLKMKAGLFLTNDREITSSSKTSQVTDFYV